MHINNKSILNIRILKKRDVTYVTRFFAVNKNFCVKYQCYYYFKIHDYFIQFDFIIILHYKNNYNKVLINTHNRYFR